MRSLDEILREASALDAADLYLKADRAPSVRVQGVVRSMGGEPVSAEEMERLLAPVMTVRASTVLEVEGSAHLARQVEGAGRYRMIVFRQQGSLAVVARRIREVPPTVESLGLPPVLNNLAVERSGLILVTGSTGSGKTTTLAALVHRRNTTCSGHIITVEDPIEFVHHDACGIVTQREVGTDCPSMERALQDALRQALDVLVVGEIHDRTSMEHALSFAETGHLVLGSLHSTNADQAVERVLGFFSAEQQPQIMLQLSLALRAIVAQRLVMCRDEAGRVPAVEVLVATERVRELLRQGEREGLKPLMREGKAVGMQTFDESLYDLARQGLVTPQVALAAADSPADLRMRFRGVQSLSVR